MVDWDGFENIQQALAQDRGVIVVTPHFGNWDIAAAAAVARGLPVTAVTEHFGNGALNERVVAARERIGMKVVPLGVSAGKAVLTALRQGEVVALVCDLPPREGRTVTVRVCGQDAVVPAGPPLLALKTGAPVVPHHVPSAGQQPLPPGGAAADRFPTHRRPRPRRDGAGSGDHGSFRAHPFGGA